jgi:hypothetical protein
MTTNQIQIALTESEIIRLLQLVSLGKDKAIENSGIVSDEWKQASVKEIDVIEKLLERGLSILETERKASDARKMLMERAG